MMMNCFCGMVDRRKVISLISSRDHCQRSSLSRISDTPRVGFEPAQNLSSGLVEWSCAVVITTAPQNHKNKRHGLKYNEYKCLSKMMLICMMMMISNISKMMLICIKQHLGSIWRSVQKKIKQHWDWVEKSRCF